MHCKHDSTPGEEKQVSRIIHELTNDDVRRVTQSIQEKRKTRNLIDHATLFHLATTLVNEEAFFHCEDSRTCILSSHALLHVMKELKFNAIPLRVTTTIYARTRDDAHGVILGAENDGQRRPAAEKYMWRGHLVVLVENQWLLDPTLDQVTNKWIRVFPCVARIPEDFMSNPYSQLFIQNGNCSVRYMVFSKQVGFKSSPDARPSHWMPVAREVLNRLTDLLGLDLLEPKERQDGFF